MAGTDRSEETVVSESQVVPAITTEGAGSPEGRENAGPLECEDCLRPLDAQRWRVSTRPPEAGTELAKQAMSVGREGRG